MNKTYSFLSGHREDLARGLELHIDRSALPSNVALELELDDDGKAFPLVQRAATRGAGDGGGVEWELLDHARWRTEVGGLTGTLLLAPGTRFRVDARAGRGVTFQGAVAAERDGKRVALLAEPKSVVRMQREPGEVRAFTLNATLNGAAPAGGPFLVLIEQRSPEGKTRGGVAVAFQF